MNILNPTEASAPNPTVKWLPPAAGLLVGGAVASFASSLPLVHSLSFDQVIISSVERVLVVFLASAATILGLCSFQSRRSRLEARRLIWQTSLDALWLSPLALFIRENSIWAVAIAAVLVSSITKSFSLLQDQDEQTDEPDVTCESQFLSLPQKSPWFWRQVCAAGAALSAQTGLLASFAGYSLIGVTLVGISSAVWTWSFVIYAPPDEHQPYSPRHSKRHILVVAVLAILFMAGGLSRYLRETYSFGGSGVASNSHSSHHLAQLVKRGQRAREKEETSTAQDRNGQPGDKILKGGASPGQGAHEQSSEGAFSAPRKSDPGIILWPKVQALTKLVAPAPFFPSTRLTSQRASEPLTLPFNGVYWFYKAPDLYPPETSRQLHGSPELLDIHSTDRRPLSMEAHEHFGSMLDLDCCSRVQIAIRNADSYPETVSLELVLINSSLPGKPSQSLGTIIVKSTRSWKLYEKQSPAVETLNFPIPANHSLRRFDEMMVVFRLQAFRADDGAKIAIDHFVLVPRGL
jgi:hypothetical protein